MYGKWVLGSVVAAALLTGCQKDTELESWEKPGVPAANAPAPAAGEAPAEQADKAGEKGEEPAETGPIVVKGSAFKVEGTETVSNRDQFRLGHYFEAEAPLELKTSVTLMNTQIEGVTTSGSAPIVGFRIRSTSGTYIDKGLEARPIDGAQTLSDPMELGPGSYKVGMTYYKDTVGGVRPTVVLKQIEFK